MSFQRPLSLSERKLLEMSRAIETNFVCKAPAGKEYLPFQLAGIEYAVQPEVKNVLIGDEPGLGKTVQAIGIANHIEARNIFVACPAKGRGVWEKHMNEWLCHDADVEIVSYNSLANLEKIKVLLKKDSFDLGIIDEVHYLKNPDAKRTKYTLAKNGLVSRFKKTVCLSGTPIQNRPIELHPVATVLAPKALGGMNKFAFGIKYCEGWKTPWGSWDFSGASNMKELGMRFRSTWMIRRTKEKVLKDLPAKFINIVYVETKGAKLEVSALDNMSVDTIIKGGAKYSGDTHLSTLRQEVGVNKVDFALEYIKEQIEAGHNKIVVFAHHKPVIDGLEQGFKMRGLDCVVVRGGTNNADELIAKFQAPGGVKIFLGSLMATKEVITLTAASYVVFVEFSWSPTDNEQAMDRTHRIGQKNSVVVDFLVHKGSLDERMAKFNIEKSKTIKEFGE